MTSQFWPDTWIWFQCRTHYLNTLLISTMLLHYTIFCICLCEASISVRDEENRKKEAAAFFGFGKFPTPTEFSNCHNAFLVCSHSFSPKMFSNSQRPYTQTGLSTTAHHQASIITSVLFVINCSYSYIYVHRQVQIANEEYIHEAE